MDIKHLSPDDSDEFLTDERCHILEIQNDSAEPDYSLARARVEPGVTTAWHRLKDVEECYYILSGHGVVEIGDDFEAVVHTGDFIRIPSGVAQRISNTGSNELVFLCFCVPAFGDGCFEMLE